MHPRTPARWGRLGHLLSSPTVAIAVVLAGCAHDSTAVPTRQEAWQALSRVVVLEDTLALEERKTAVVVFPLVHASGTTLAVADAKEHQARVYDTQGNLRRAVGRRGGGPSEFSTPPTAAFVLPSGELVAGEFNGTIQRFAANADTATYRHRVPLLPLYTVTVLNDSELVAAGPRSVGDRAAPQTMLLHVLDRQSFAVRRSFFPLNVLKEFRFAANSLGNVSLFVKSDTITAVFAMFDSVFVFTASGQRLSATQLGLKHFRRVQRPQPPGTSIAARHAWLKEISLMNSIYPLSNGGWLIQYAASNGPQPLWALAIVEPNGVVAFEEINTPRLLAATTDSMHSILYFQNPRHEEPNQWYRASYPVP